MAEDWTDPKPKRDPVKQWLYDYMRTFSEVHGRNATPQLSWIGRMLRDYELNRELVGQHPFDGISRPEPDRGYDPRVPGRKWFHPDAVMYAPRSQYLPITGITLHDRRDGYDLNALLAPAAPPGAPPPIVTMADVLERFRKSGKPGIAANDNLIRHLPKRLVKLLPLLARINNTISLIDLVAGALWPGAPDTILGPDLSLFDAYPWQRWVLVNGPNELFSNYGANYTNDIRMSYGAYIDYVNTGPNTALLELQAGEHLPVGSLVGVTANRLNYGYMHQFLDRHAQYMTFERIDDGPAPYPNATVDLQRQIDAAMPSRSVALLPDPFHLAPRLPVPDYIGRRHNSPAVSEVLRALENPLLGNRSIQPNARGRSRPSQRPGRPAPQPGKAPVIENPTHIRKPPGKGVKERKPDPKGNIFQRALGDALGAFSEVNDAIEVLHDALPDEYKAKSFYRGRAIQPSWDKMWAAVYQHINEVDMSRAIPGLVRNHYQDKLVGILSRGANNASYRGGRHDDLRANRFRRLRH